MTAKGHVLLTTATAYPIVKYSLENHSTITTISISLAVVLGSLLPDIDEPNSYIGNRAKLIAYSLKAIGIKHRTITHWLIFPLVVAFAGYALSDSFFTPVLYALAFGILMHDVGDMLTKGGINGFFFPFFPNTKIAILPRFLRFQTFSITEQFFVIFLFLFNAYIYIYLSTMKGVSVDYIQKFTGF